MFIATARCCPWAPAISDWCGRLRSLVSRAFTPKVLTKTEVAVRYRAHRLIAAMADNHSDRRGELISEVAAQLPLQVICDMMGIPEDGQQTVFDLTNVILGFGDPDVSGGFTEFAAASATLGQ